MQANPSFLILKSSHGKIIHLDFLWHTRSSIGNHWGPSGALGGPQSLKHAETCLKSSDIPLSTIHGSNTQFAKVKLSFTKIFYLDFLRHTRLSIGEPPGCLGGPQSLKTAKTSYKSSDIPLSTIHASKAQFSHSEIIP